MDNKWREDLNKVLGEAPLPPPDEYQRIMRRASRRVSRWPTFLCATSLAFSILVSIFIKPESTSSTDNSSLALEVTSAFDESLDTLQDLADQVK